MSQINLQAKKQKENYMIIVPGRMGSNNRDWGIQSNYSDVNQAVAIFEYGVDITGRAEPLLEKTDQTEIRRTRLP